MANYENVCSYGESLSETLRKLKEDVNKMKWWGWRPQGGITIAHRSEFYAGQKMQKTAEKCNYDYDIVWAFASNLTKARREFNESLEVQISKGWNVQGDVAELHRIGVYSKNSEVWYIAQAMIKEKG